VNIVFLTKRKSGKRGREIRTRGREKKEGRGGEIRTAQNLLRKDPFSHRPRGAVNVLLGEASFRPLVSGTTHGLANIHISHCHPCPPKFTVRTLLLPLRIEY
jgi:hypothetical protein